MNTSKTIQTTDVVARLIRDNRTEVEHPNTNDPLMLIKTMEELISFPSVDCILHTNRIEDAKSNNCEFVILISNKGEEKYYALQLQQGDDNARKCICYEPITDWDKDAKLVQL